MIIILINLFQRSINIQAANDKNSNLYLLFNLNIQIKISNYYFRKTFVKLEG